MTKGMNPVQYFHVPCGQCTGCKMERSRQWAIRCVHEASLYKQNCFVTLTYNDQHLPDLNSLEYGAFQLFMKRLRKRYNQKEIRFYMCGEYGEKGDRPHYHIILFNHQFEDIQLFKTTPAGNKLFTSEILNSLWPYGFCTIGEVNFETAAYTARYIMKKVNGKDNMTYAVPDRETGEILYKEKEFNHMSLKPGIGAKWLEKWQSDVFPHDFVVINGKKIKPPKYYTQKYKKNHPEEYEELQYQRELEAKKHSKDNTAERLLVKEVVLKAKLNQNRRELK